ncbi:MFS transporter [Sporolactobacillus sp. THM7-4]|nr:MFS transporter [Sporolactobacillus sp. THM7-4]
MSILLGKRSRYLTLSILFTAWFIGYFDRMAINIAIIPISKEFSLLPEQSGLILSSFFIGYSIMQFFGGWFADKFGSRKVLITCVLAWSIFTGLTGIATSFITLFLVRFMFGLGEGSFSPASSVAVAENFPRMGRARAKSILLSSYQLAGIAGSFGIASLMTLYNWRDTFHILAASGIIITLLLWISLPSPQLHGLKNSEERIKALLKLDLIWKVLIVWFGISIVNWGLATWMPSYLTEARHMQLMSMGLVSSIPAAAGFISILLSGWILDKYMNGHEKLLLVYGSLFTALFLYMMFTAHSISMAITFWALCQFSFGTVFVTVFALPLKYMSEKSIGTATGLINFGGQIAGIIAPSLIGVMVELFHGSYNAAFWSLIAAAILSLVTGITLTIGRIKGPLPEEI